MQRILKHLASDPKVLSELVYFSCLILPVWKNIDVGHWIWHYFDGRLHYIWFSFKTCWKAEPSDILNSESIYQFGVKYKVSKAQQNQILLSVVVIVLYQWLASAHKTNADGCCN